MSSVVISGDVSGSVTLQAPSTAGSTTLTLPATSGTVVTDATTSGISGSAITTGTVGVSVGGTGANSATAYAVQCGGTTSTGAHQSVASLGTSGQVLTSQGASALPTWTTISTSPPTTLYDIGTYIVGRPYNATDYAPNATIAGSSLYGMPTDAYLNNGGTPYIYNAQQGGARQPSTDLVNTGTWRCMSRAWGNTGDTGGTGLWVRIS